MKLFPKKNHTARLNNDYSVAVEALRVHTDFTETLISSTTDKKFRGQIDSKGFKLISSEIGYGAICVLIGEFASNTGKLEIRLNKAFKVMFSILMLLPIIGFAMFVFVNNFMDSLIALFPLILILLIVRFVFIELSFQIVAKIGIRKLLAVLEIKELK